MALERDVAVDGGGEGCRWGGRDGRGERDSGRGGGGVEGGMTAGVVVSGMSAVPGVATAVCVGAVVWWMGSRHSAARRAQLLLAGGGAVAVGPPSWRQLAGELRRICERLRAEWWSAVAGLAL